MSIDAIKSARGKCVGTCLVIAAAMSMTAAQATAAYQLKLDLDSTSPVTEPGYISAQPVVYTSARGWGWDGLTNIKTRDRVNNTHLRRDFHFDREDATFLIDVPVAGLYDVSLLFEDESVHTHDLISVYAEGIRMVHNVTAGRGTPVWRHFEIPVEDNQLTLLFTDGGGNDPNWVVNAIEVLEIPLPEPTTLAPMTLGGLALIRRHHVGRV